MGSKEQMWLKRMAKGFGIGSVMLVPGASGSTIAIILGIYDELIHGVSALRTNPRLYGLQLLQYAIAGVLGIVLMSGPIWCRAYIRGIWLCRNSGKANEKASSIYLYANHRFYDWFLDSNFSGYSTRRRMAELHINVSRWIWHIFCYGEGSGRS